MRARLAALTIVLATAVLGGVAVAQKLATDELLSAVVEVKTFINPDGRTVEILGREREGSGIVIDDQGLVLTIGYLMVEAHAAQVATNDGHTVPANFVGYDSASGFGLLKAVTSLKVRPMALGKSANLREGDPVIAARGVRRSCDTELSNVLRRRSVSTASRDRSASLARCTRSRPEAA